MTSLTKPRAVLFDWDDTIIESWGPTLKAINTAFIAMGAPVWSDEEARRRAGPSARDLFQQMFGDRWQEADKLFFDAIKALFSEKLPVYDGVEDILRALSEAGVYLAVVSNKRGALLRSEVEQSGFERYFGKVVGAGDASADKPDPAVVRLALEGSGITPGPHVWFVGDSHTDMLCAANAGITGVLLETKPPPAEALVKAPPLRKFKDHSNLMEYIKRSFIAI